MRDHRVDFACCVESLDSNPAGSPPAILAAIECGRFNGMTVTMDSAGRVVLPKAIRERAQLKPGTALEVRVVDGRIELEPASATVRIEKKGDVWVATPTTPGPVLTQEQVDATLDAIRMRSLGGDDE